MNRTVKEATIKRFHYPDLDGLRAHVLTFIAAYNFAKHLRALRWRTPFEAVCRAWPGTPDIFKINPRHLIPGPNMRGAGVSPELRPPGREPGHPHHLGLAATGMERKAARQQVQQQAGQDGVGAPGEREAAEEGPGRPQSRF